MKRMTETQSYIPFVEIILLMSTILMLSISEVVHVHVWYEYCSNAYLYFWNICKFKLSVRWRGLGDITRYKSKQFLIHVLPFGKHNVFLQSQVGFFLSQLLYL